MADKIYTGLVGFADEEDLLEERARRLPAPWAAWEIKQAAQQEKGPTPWPQSTAELARVAAAYVGPHKEP